jgi:hypothetical protein
MAVWTMHRTFQSHFTNECAENHELSPRGTTLERTENYLVHKRMPPSVVTPLTSQQLSHQDSDASSFFKAQFEFLWVLFCFLK